MDTASSKVIHTAWHSSSVPNWNVSSVIGLGVNISNIFFDFRYEIGLTNISKEIIYEKNINGEISHEKGIVINRHKNVLSFSLGVIF